MDHDVCVKAKEALDEAVANMMQAMDRPGVLATWVMVAHTTELGDGGVPEHSYEWLASTDQPYHSALGLVQVLDEIVRTQDQADTYGPPEDDE